MGRRHWCHSDARGAPGLCNDRWIVQIGLSSMDEGTNMGGKRGE